MAQFLFGLVLFLTGSSMIIVWGLATWFGIRPRDVAYVFVRALTQTEPNPAEAERLSVPWWLPGSDALNAVLGDLRDRAGKALLAVSAATLAALIVGGGSWFLYQVFEVVLALLHVSKPWWAWWLFVSADVLVGLFLYTVWEKVFYSPPDVLGRARWARLSEVGNAGLLTPRPASLYMGRFLHADGQRTPQELFYHGDRHLLTVGPQRSGKGAGLIIPNLSTVKKSMLVLDAKGELAAITARKRRALGSDIVIFNPFQWLAATHPHLKGRGFNPLAGLDWRSPRFVDEAKAIAAAMVLLRESNNPFFDSAARQLVAFLIMWVCFKHSRDLEKNARLRTRALDAEFTGKQPSKEEVTAFLQKYNEAHRPLKKHPDLSDVRYWLSDGVGAGVVKSEDDKDTKEKAIGITKLCRTIRDEDPDLADDPERGVPTVLKDLAKRFAATPTDGLRDVVNTAQEQLGFLYGSDSVMEWLSGDGFDFRCMRHSLTTVYVILPSEEMADYSALARIVVGVAFRQLQSAVSSRMGSVVFLLDEFLQLGRMEKLLGSYDQAAGLGVQLWPIVQHFPRFKAVYGPEWENFISGAGMISAFVSGDGDTAQELSRLCGQTTVIVPTSGGHQLQATGLTLLDDQLRLADGELLLFKRGTERGLPGVPFPFKGYAPRYYEKGSRFNEGLDERPIGVE